MLTCLKVTKQFGDATPILAGIDLDVSRGEFISIQGKSGSGKSTLLNIIAGLTPATSGQVLFQGERVGAMSARGAADYRRQRIGFVFQLYHLIPVLSALENVSIPLLPYAPANELHDRAAMLLEQVGLGARLGALPHELSGGEMQRVAIARALLNQPSLVLADEPTGNLDAQTAAGVLSVLEKSTVNGGIGLLLVTHDGHLASRAPRRFALGSGVLSPVP